MRWADTDSDDSDDEFQTHPSRSGSAMGNLIVNPQVRKKESRVHSFIRYRIVLLSLLCAYSLLSKLTLLCML